MAVRQAGECDAEGIVKVHVASIRGLAREVYSAEQIASWSGGKEPERYRQAMRDGEVMFVAVGEDGVLVGFAGYAGDEVRAVYVHPDQARAGIGSALLAAVEAHARLVGVLGLRLTASLNAVPFYEARGYIAVMHREHELSRGGVLDVVDMTKRLG